MPTYEYRCPDGHTFQQFFKTISGAAGELPCPECGKVAGRQMSGGAGLVFKGSGFYLTDYGKNAHRKSAPDSKSSSAEGGKSDGGKSDAGKGAAKSDAGGAKSPGGGGAGGDSRSSSPTRSASSGSSGAKSE